VTQPHSQRIATLDALRGVAALAVVFSHAIDKDAWPAWLSDLTPLGMCRDGRAPVILFFVLSGLALTLSLKETRVTGYLPFAARRICRIWVPFAVAILIAALCAGLVDTHPLTADEVRYPLWSPEIPSLDETLDTLVMLGQRKDSVLDSPVWSLTHELRISLIIPVLVLAQRRHGLQVIVGTFALTAIVAYLYGSLFDDILPLYGKTPRGSFEVTAYYVWFFCLGIGTALHRDAIMNFASRYRAELWMLSLVFLSIQWESRLLTDVLYGIGSMLLIWGVMVSPRVSDWLMTPVMQWLGRMSYSLYLTHLIVFLTLHFGLRNFALPFNASLLLGLPIALVVSHLFTRFVDAPAIMASRHVARRVAQWRDSGIFHPRSGTGTPTV
jgi:peptidoglycan/LPS O-acetylase OafA/YrhL